LPLQQQAGKQARETAGSPKQQLLAAELCTATSRGKNANVILAPRSRGRKLYVDNSTQPTR